MYESPTQNPLSPTEDAFLRPPHSPRLRTRLTASMPAPPWAPAARRPPTPPRPRGSFPACGPASARAGCRTSSTSLLYLWVATCTSTSPPPPLPSTSSAVGQAGCETRWPGGRRPPPRRAPVRRWSVGESDAYLRSERRATQNGWCLWVICWRVYLVGKTLCKTYFWVWVTISCWRQP